MWPQEPRRRHDLELRERLGYRINHKRVERLLRRNGWGMIAAGTENVVIVIPLVAPRCRRGPPTAPGRSVKRLFRGFARSGDGSGGRSRATDSRRALRTASSDTSPCSEAA